MVSIPSSSVSSTETSKVSSRAMTNSTRSRLSASRSSANRASLVILSSGTWSTSTAHPLNFSNVSSLLTTSPWSGLLGGRSRWCSVAAALLVPVPAGSQSHGQSAVDRQYGTGHIPGPVGGEEPDDGGDLVGPGHPSQRD